MFVQAVLISETIRKNIFFVTFNYDKMDYIFYEEWKSNNIFFYPKDWLINLLIKV